MRVKGGQVLNLPIMMLLKWESEARGGAGWRMRRQRGGGMKVKESEV